MQKKYPDNGNVDSSGRLTKQGQQRVTEFMAKYPRPIAFVKRFYPSTAGLLEMLVRRGTITMDDFHQTVAEQVTKGVMQYDPNRCDNITTVLCLRIVSAANKIISQNLSYDRMKSRAFSISHWIAEGDEKMVMSLAEALHFHDDPSATVEPFGEFTAKMAKLSPQQLHIIHERAINDRQNPDIAKELGVTRERVRQMFIEIGNRMEGVTTKISPEKHKEKWARLKGRAIPWILKNWTA